MSICGSCGSETTRSRVIFGRNEVKEECPNCAPQSFEKVADPSTRKIWIGPEFEPNSYEKRYDADGVYYVPKPEVTAERERNLFVCSEEKAAYEKKLEEKRAQRRTQPLDQMEIAAALRKIDMYLRPQIEDPDTCYDA